MGGTLIDFRYGIEKNGQARAVLQSHAPSVACATDILAWLPPDIKLAANGCTGAKLRELIFDADVALNMGRGGEDFEVGDVHVTGPTCVDFSPMGAQRREGGSSMPVFLTWARALRD